MAAAAAICVSINEVTMSDITPEELQVLRNKAAVLDFIACQSKGNMEMWIFHWYPTCPPKVEKPDIEPFTKPNVCTCFDVMGFLDPGEHFPECPKIGVDGHVLAEPFQKRK